MMQEFYNALKISAPALVGIGVFFMLHIIVWRIKGNSPKGVFLIIIFAVISYAFSAFVIGSRFNLKLYSHIWTSAPLFAFMIMMYLHFYVGIDRSVSVRILGELLLSDDRTLAIEELNAVYSGEDMVRHRVDLLVDKGWLSEDNGQYKCTSKAQFLVRTTILAQKLYGINVSG